MILSEDQAKRYARHILLPEVGEEGQKKLLKARVLVAGTGGLGCPASLYLAAAGVGTLGLVDFDRVDTSNLQRQILFNTADVGRPKAEVAAKRLRALNPDVTVNVYDMALKRDNIMEILKDYDIIVTAPDNFPTRYLTNDAAVLLGKPNIYSAVFRFEGQVTVFKPKEGPCYRCLYPEPPPSRHPSARLANRRHGGHGGNPGDAPGHGSHQAHHRSRRVPGGKIPHL